MSIPTFKSGKEDCKRIAAIGDICGDFEALLLSLSRANIINKKGEWIGGNTKVIQVVIY